MQSTLEFLFDIRTAVLLVGVGAGVFLVDIADVYRLHPLAFAASVPSMVVGGIGLLLNYLSQWILFRWRGRARGHCLAVPTPPVHERPCPGWAGSKWQPGEPGLTGRLRAVPFFSGLCRMRS